MRKILTAALFATSALGASAAPVSDLHGVNVGMQADALPSSYYGNFACADAPAKQIAGWSAWRACPTDAEGLHVMRVTFEKPGEDETIVAGHPVTLALGFDSGGRLARIVIETVARTSLYMRKKAFLLGRQAQSHYGASGWNCRSAKPSQGEEAIGGVFIKRECSKTLDDRKVDVVSSLFHKAGGAPADFVSSGRVVITWRPQRD